MGRWKAISAILVLCVTLMLLLPVASSALVSAYADPAEEGNDDDLTYSTNYLDDVMAPFGPSQKRHQSCVPRNGNCDHRLKDCCYNSSCRCNLWGSNCRCQRMGLFQKWGRK